MTTPRNVITIGGGKGGIGKSVMCTNLAVGMALSGHKVILVDTDYGASNLHALLGIGNPKCGFVDFYNHDCEEVNSILLDTGIENLKFVSGAGDNPGSANLDSNHREKIQSFISKLNADTVFIDLGPGTNFNVLDYYNIGTQGVVLTVPEMPSILNTFSFIKAALFRRLDQEFIEYPFFSELVNVIQNSEEANKMYSIEKLKERVDEREPYMIPRFEEIVASFRPNLVMNKVRHQQDLILGQNLKKLAKKYLDVDLEYLGYIIESERVRDSVNDMIPFLIKDPQSKPSENLQKVIGGLTNSDIHLVKKDDTILVSKQVRLSSSWGK